MEINAIRETLSATNWNRRKAAELLGISYNTLRRRIDAYSLYPFSAPRRTADPRVGQLVSM